MTKLNVIQWGHPTLRKVAEPVKEEELDEQFIKDMLDTMYKEDGVGLAAPQVNISKQLVVCTDGDKEYILINPKIIASSERKKEDYEGCLSLPGLNAKVPRSEKVIVEYRDEKWQEQKVTARGFLAVVFQHEIDHLNGVLYIDRADLSTLEWNDSSSVPEGFHGQLTDLNQVRDSFIQSYHQDRQDMVFERNNVA